MTRLAGSDHESRRSDDLSGLAAQGHPHPDLLDFFEHKRPQPIGFQRGGSGILWVRGEQGWISGRKLSYFFLIHVDTVVRETPNVRVRPRKLLRSRSRMPNLLAAKLTDRHWESGSRGFAVRRHDSDTAVCALWA